jgi:hypothetical protein
LASSGSVYVSNGSGSGTWKKVDTSSMEGLGSQSGTPGLVVLSDGIGGFKYALGSAYGSIVINNNSTNFAITAAADSTLNTNSDYEVLSGAGAPWTPDLTYEVGTSSDSLIPARSGIYRVETWLDIVSFPSNSSRLAVKYIVNGNQFSLRKLTVKSNSGGDSGNISGFGLLQLTGGDEIKLAVASTDTGNIVFESGNIALTLIRAL